MSRGFVQPKPGNDTGSDAETFVLVEIKVIKMPVQKHIEQRVWSWILIYHLKIIYRWLKCKSNSIFFNVFFFPIFIKREGMVEKCFGHECLKNSFYKVLVLCPFFQLAHANSFS